MGLTLQEVLGRTLKKLEESSFQRFIEKLSDWEVRKEEYTKIPEDELTGKDPEHVAGLINQYYKSAYGAEVTLTVLQDIDEKKVREELQCYLREVDTSGHGLGTAMYTDNVNFIENHRSDLIISITDVDPVLCDLRDQQLLTQEQYSNVMEKRRSQEKMRELCDIIRHWEDTGKYTAYTVLRKYNEEIISDLEMEETMRRKLYSVHSGNHFIDRHEQDLIDGIKNVDPVISDLYRNNLLTRKERDNIRKYKPEDRMRRLYDIIKYCDDSDKEKVYDTLYKHNPRVMKYLKMLEDPSKLVKTGDHFIDRHEQDLINGIKNVRPVIYDLYWNNLLTGGERDYIMEISEPEDIMRSLYDIIRYCDDSDKEKVYDTLYKYNPSIMEYLKKPKDPSKLVKTGDHVIDRHKQDLINGIKNVEPVISDLHRNNLLTGEERDYIMEISEPEDMMRRLYDIIRYRDFSDKEKVYDTLYKYNPRVINFLKKPKDPSKLVTTGDHVIDRHKQYLIGGIKNVDPVISDLYWYDLLTREERDYIMEISEPEDRMRRLYYIIRYCDDSDKEKVYAALYKCNPRVMEYLKKPKDPSKLVTAGNHFIDRHEQDLIDGIKIIYPVISDLYRNNLLTREELDYIMEISGPEDIMRSLYDIIRYCDDSDKEKVYDTLYEYNPRVMEYLKKPKDLLKLVQTGNHFIDRHKQDLIDGIKIIYPVIYDLCGNNLLTRKELDYIMRISEPEDMMRRLYDIIRYCDDSDKEKVYKTLYKYNPRVIDVLKKAEKTGNHFIDRHEQDLIGGIKNVDPVISDLYRNNLLTRKERDNIRKYKPEDRMRRLYDIIRFRDDSDKVKVYDTLFKYNPRIIDVLKKPEKKTSQEIMNMTVDKISCKLCGEEEQDLAKVIHTIGRIYRLELTSPGLYRCQKTRIKFLVKGPVIIEYKLDSWTDNLKNFPDKSYEILGPLFNITTIGEANAVSAVYLPHYLCLKGFSEDTALIKCAHFKDGNMTLETPTQIDPFYITLENPEFSLLGAIMSFVFPISIPIHGIVLIYFTILCKGNPYEEHRIHLYVLPYTANVEETIDKANKEFGYQRIKKPEHTINPVYTKIKYLVTGDPGVSVCPKTLMFHTEPYQYTELQLKEKDVDIALNVSDENSKDPVWKTQLTQCDMMNITQLLSQLTIHEGACAAPLHFVDRHRDILIQRSSNMDSVLDILLQERLLDQGQYETVRCRQPDHEKMRQLYAYMTSWGYNDKEKLYQALKKKNSPLIRDLESKDNVNL
ncbi:uncharacterized protein LOC130367542 isoform X2 [Hyla sarda]|uniref:uncharacterized protein LOC130367542 isoform X2 n=1 Tax=Hyla sarda TaxID=327740 RepID=UPI0024C3B04A|nr:uncharacterized protein LOC130367542 isoform X2 [Hyla sarda]